MYTDPNIYLARRVKLAKSIGDGCVLLINNPVPKHYAEKHQIDKDLYYLSGLEEENTALVLLIENGKITKEVGYCLKKNDDYERWNGKINGIVNTKNNLHLDEVQAFESLTKIIKTAFFLYHNIYIKFDAPSTVLNRLFTLASQKLDANSYAINDLRHHLAHLRVVKDKYELQLIKQSCEIAAKTQLAIMQEINSAKTEAHLAAFLGFSYTKQNASHAFIPIVANGANACIAHYLKNNAKLRNGNLVLIDSGCELNYYTSDITRVYPKNKKFSPLQKQMYNIVLNAQRAAINLIQPGKTLDSLQKASKRVLAKGLKDLGICTGSIEAIIKSAKFNKYYFHNIGHMIGLDVHDPTPSINNKKIKFTKNMVLTVEPGLYFDNDPSIPKEIRNTGIRIEDTILVTNSGYENLTNIAPKKIKQIEELMAE